MIYTDALIEAIRQRLEESLANWRLPPGSKVEMLTVSENITYLARSADDSQRLILRLHRPNYHQPGEIESELAWIEALRADNALHTPAIIDGEAGRVCSVEVDGESYAVVAFDFVAGNEPNVGEDLPRWFEQLGAVTATLHQHSRRWPRPEGFVRKEWNLNTMLAADGHWGDWRSAEGLDAQSEALIAAAIAKIEQRVEAYGAGSDRFGLVHADLRLANLLVDDDRLWVIDFDDCGISWFAYDFAAAISFYELDPSIPELQSAWVKGYRSKGEFTAEDEAMLASFIMIRRIMLTAWLANHSESGTYAEFGEGYAAGTASLAQRYLEGEF
ncbi:phosphotransferase enzyme family protein [Marinobacterium mangrovicola]|uniref:Ser/Thr protein kinase RdoA (MazF antagonist) n=1 Tax=Marinobacterium mangrovicola TaxID=1476959 RepID=A0A4R1GRN4_9GAMM|nr:phosphotransferase [Marinobacterium mangrovicola]TCK07192.1 Ser/Thr protein kinase RdoA (MazF antagonist) [Marinobacterium mangrovicola]